MSATARMIEDMILAGFAGENAKAHTFGRCAGWPRITTARPICSVRKILPGAGSAPTTMSSLLFQMQYWVGPAVFNPVKRQIINVAKIMINIYTIAPQSVIPVVAS